MPDWDVGEVTNANSAFSNRNNFNAAIGNWNTSQVTDMSNMLGMWFDQDIENWNTAQVKCMADMFGMLHLIRTSGTGTRRRWHMGSMFRRALPV